MHLAKRWKPFRADVALNSVPRSHGDALRPESPKRLLSEFVLMFFGHLIKARFWIAFVEMFFSGVPGLRLGVAFVVL